MGQGIDDLSIEALLEMFQALTEPGGKDGGWRAEPSPESSGEGAPFERVVVDEAIAPVASRDASADEPMPMGEASDADSGTWLWLEH
jgi:hypothetical protein